MSPKLLNSSKSISSLALKSFDKYFNYLNIDTKISTSTDNLVRMAYYGGRCEVFGNLRYNESVYHFDFTGMYSSIMRDSFCYGNSTLYENISSTNEPGFYKVDILSLDMHIPVLPYRNNKLLFPNGMWTGTYWWEELNYFKENGGIILKIYWLLKFDNVGCPFQSFISTFSNYRKNSAFDKVFWKLFINSLSGRFGMAPENETTEIVICDKSYQNIRDHVKILKEKQINNIKIITYANPFIRNEVSSNVTIAAAVTAKARIKLHKAYKDVILNGGRILYSDTDSIFAAFSRDILGETHGEIFWDPNKDDTTFDSAIFAIPKGYALMKKNKEIVKLKGYKRSEITFKEFYDAFHFDMDITKKQIYFKKTNLLPFLLEIEKTTKLTNYTKRKFNENKTDTSPLEIWPPYN